MSDLEQLKNTVTELRRELADGEPIDDEHRRALEAALGEILPLLEDAADEADDRDHGSVVDTLQSVAERLEDSHPQLTLALGAVADQLSRLGI